MVRALLPLRIIGSSYPFSVVRQPMTKGRPPCSIQCQCHVNDVSPYGSISQPTAVLRIGATQVRSTPKMKFVGLWVMQQVGPSLLRAGSQLLDDNDNRLRR